VYIKIFRKALHERSAVIFVQIFIAVRIRLAQFVEVNTTVTLDIMTIAYLLERHVKREQVFSVLNIDNHVFSFVKW
jgi:hypothetical protein